MLVTNCHVRLVYSITFKKNVTFKKACLLHCFAYLSFDDSILNRYVGNIVSCVCVRPESNETRENVGRHIVASYNLELCSSFLSEPAVICPNGTTMWDLLF